MTPGEIHNLKRKNFIEKTKKYFEFLVLEYGYNKPNHIRSQQPNNVIIRDKFIYKGYDKTIIILNAYHPVDYGFQINLIHNQTGQTQMIHYVLKENQDVEQSYLKKASEFLKNRFA